MEDGFRFAYKTLTGDGEIIARVTGLDQSNPWNKCGIMIRESLSPGSRHAFIALTSGNGAAFQNRIVTNGISNSVNTGQGIKAPYWIRLEKKGSKYNAKISPDGSTWSDLGQPVDAGFGDGIPVYGGLALSSHVIDKLSTATIDNYAYNGILEVELQQFTAVPGLNQTVNLQWVTTLEKGMMSFTVERSPDNIYYTPILSQAANNNGRYTQIYNDVDKNPLPIINYYRLKMLNSNGLIKYSAPVFLRTGGSSAPLIFPNPARNVVHIASGADPIEYINMFDIGGRLVRQEKGVGQGILDININALSNGIYIMEIKTASNTFREKLIIQN